MKTQVWVGQCLFFCSLKYIISTQDGKKTFSLYYIYFLNVAEYLKEKELLGL